MIVYDSPAMRSFVRRVMKLSGIEVAECFETSNGEESLSLLRTHWVDAILTDINMPGCDGEEFLRRLSQDELLCSIPVTVISTDATKNRMSRMFALGARGYITKPFLPEDLRKELERTLGAPNV